MDSCCVSGRKAECLAADIGPRHFAGHRIGARIAFIGALFTTPLLMFGSACAQIDVGPSGSATYGYPLKAAPGVAGVEPRLALAHVGGSGGPAGVGWTLRGPSAIARCPASVAVDGFAGRVNFDDSDKLCLNGARLIQTNASGVPLAFPQVDDAKALGSGQVREFRTESDGQLRVRAYGTHAAGVRYFKAWARDGLVYEFGMAPGSESTTIDQIQSQRPTQAWVLTRVSDQAGNDARYSYVVHVDSLYCSAPNAPTASYSYPRIDWGLSRVDYASTGGASPAMRNSVQFEYEAEPCGPGRSMSLHMGSARVRVARLKTVRMFAVDGATAIRRYELSYVDSASTNRPLLQSVVECAGTGAACLPATTFAYTAGALSFLEDSAFGLNAAGQTNGLTTTLLKRDAVMGGDGAIGTIEADFNEMVDPTSSCGTTTLRSTSFISAKGRATTARL